MQSINAMNLLWAFEFSPGKDAKGEEIKPDIWNFAQVRLFSSASKLSFNTTARRCQIRPIRSSTPLNLAAPDTRKLFVNASLTQPQSWSHLNMASRLKT